MSNHESKHLEDLKESQGQQYFGIDEKGLVNVVDFHKQRSIAKNVLWIVGVAFLFVGLVAVLFIVLKNNRINGNIEKIAVKEKDKPAIILDQDNEENKSSGFGSMIGDTKESVDSFDEKEEAQVSEPTPTPISVMEQTPMPTPTPQNDLELYAISIWNRYHQENNHSVMDGDSLLYQEFEEEKGIGAIILSTFIENKGPVAVDGFAVQLVINGQVKEEKKHGALSSGEKTTQIQFILPQDIGEYNVEVKVNMDKRIIEKDYTNNSRNRIYKVVGDTTPPEIIAINTMRDNENKQTCLMFDVTDNVSQPQNMTYYEALDYEDYHEINWDHGDELGYRKCISGPAGENHQYAVKVVDEAGNKKEDIKFFQLYAF